MRRSLLVIGTLIVCQTACSGDKGEPGTPGPAGTGTPGAAGPPGPAGTSGSQADGGTSNVRNNVDHLELPGATFPESITAAADGTLFVSSAGLGAVIKFAPNSITPTFFIAPGTAVKNSNGVLVDDEAGLLYLCANDFCTRSRVSPCVPCRTV